ncbi:MAG: phospholipase [Sphingomonadales bacterium]|nr:phospholipase [Sphingomonadales bacterium]
MDAKNSAAPPMAPAGVVAPEDCDSGVSPSVWRYAHADRAHVIVDAAAYFEQLQAAMLRAHERIMLIGWDFDTRIRLAYGRRWWNLPRRRHFPARLGGFMVWLVRRHRPLEVLVLRWNFATLSFLLRGTMVLDLLRWKLSRAIRFRLDGAHPFGCSHHQKIVVIDDQFAACGGIDMTGDRWDTPAHLDDDPRRRRPNGKPFGPWHDMAMLVEGPAAAALAELARDRWRHAGGGVLPPCRPRPGKAWPEGLRAEFENVEIGIARTRAGWRDAGPVREIEALFVEQIAAARRFIYAESQYFASRRIAEAFARRLTEPDPPEIVLVTALASTSWLQQQAMDTARVELLRALGLHDHAGRLSVWVPHTAAGTPIYVHAKLLIVDDVILRIGSANFNNRSMGLDSECDLFIDARRAGNAHAAPVIARLRQRLLAEHCGIDEALLGERLERAGSMAALIAGASGAGKRLRPFVLQALTNTKKAIADSALLDAESPEEIFEPIAKRRGLFRRGGLLRRPG